MYVLMLVLCLAVSLPQSGKNKRDRNPNSNSTHKESVTPQQSLGASNFVQQPTVKATEQQYDPYADRLYRSYLGATIVAAFFSIVFIAMLVWQNFLTRKVATAAKENADAAFMSAQAVMNAERCWLFPEVVKYSDECFGLQFINGGRTPAQIIVISIFPRLRPTAEELPLPPTYGMEGLSFEQVRALIPGKKWAIPDWKIKMSTDLSTEEMAALRGMSKRYVVYGIAKYVDVFRPKEIHESRFCYFYSPVIDEMLPYGPPEYTKYT